MQRYNLQYSRHNSSRLKLPKKANHPICTTTLRFLGPSSSIRSIDCQVPKAAEKTPAKKEKTKSIKKKEPVVAKKTTAEEIEEVESGEAEEEEPEVVEKAPAKEAKEPKAAEKAPSPRFCGHCGKPVDTQFCPFCGKEVKTGQTALGQGKS